MKKNFRKRYLNALDATKCTSRFSKRELILVLLWINPVYNTFNRKEKQEQRFYFLDRNFIKEEERWRWEDMEASIVPNNTINY